MRYLSVCSGIEAATVAWHGLGWKPAAFSEIEKFPSQVLMHHYSDVPNVGDMTKFKEWDIGAIDLLVGGTPCQSFSVAGLRKGLDDPRGNLMLTYLAIARQYQPKWLVWENVPGVLSSNGGHDFASFLRGLGECGYGFAYRILDAQYFGVAQRRRRVFVVGCLGDWRSAAAVLFERESLSGNPAPSREKGEEVAKCLTRGAAQRLDSETETMIPTYGIPGNWIGRKPENGGNAVEPMVNIAPCLTKTDRHRVAQPIPLNTQVILRHKAMGKGTGFGMGEAGDPAYTLSKAHHHAVAQPLGGIDYENNAHLMHEPTGPLLKGSPTSGGRPLPALVYPMAVRRLTPTECERLQGFPDGYTDIQPKGKPTPDGPRYKALGNSMAVPVMKWIGERIVQKEAP